MKGKRDTEPRETRRQGHAVTTSERKKMGNQTPDIDMEILFMAVHNTVRSQQMETLGDREGQTGRDKHFS